jgi:hypothetical protein
MTALLETPRLRTPTMMYLFHRIEERLDGQPTMILIDEGWKALDDAVFVARIKDWRRAYLEFANAGVTVVDGNGHANLRIRKPQPYTVPVKGRLEAHVHWRTCGDNGFLGPVETTMIAVT